MLSRFDGLIAGVVLDRRNARQNRAGKAFSQIGETLVSCLRPGAGCAAGESFGLSGNMPQHALWLPFVMFI
jgi:hypothetical protein